MSTESFLLSEPPPKTSLRFRTSAHIVDPDSFDKMPVRFRFDLIDLEHELWGFRNLTAGKWLEMVKFFQSIEKQTWAELKLASGGRRQGTNHHSLKISWFHKEAQKRIRDLNLEKIIEDHLFSLRMNNTTRLYGHREENFFRIIWFDPYHGDSKRGAYPVKG